MPAFKDITNSVINGYLVVRRSILNPKTKRYLWVFRCKCGREFEAGSSAVKRGRRVCASCRTYGRFKDLTGNTFGRMLVIERVGSDNSDAMWKTKCTECDKTFTHRTEKLKLIKYCPCMVGKGGIKHGHTKHGGWRTPTYTSWDAMMARCYHPSYPKKEYYSEKGIRVCERWHDFQNFLADMGERPEGTTLGRIDHNKNYSPDNCRWETWKEQNQGRQRNSKGQYSG